MATAAKRAERPKRSVLEFKGERHEMRTKLPPTKAPAKMGNSPHHFPGSQDVGKKRGTIKNLDTPLGQTAAFLNYKMGRLGLSPQDLAGTMNKAGWEGGHYAVRKWLTGSNGPALGDLRYVAKALGYPDWVAFVADVGKHRRKK